MIADPVRAVQSAGELCLPDDLVLFRKFAGRRGVHVGTLHRQRLRHDDAMPAWKILGRWYVSESEFAAWSARRSGRTTSQQAMGASVPTPAARRRQIEKAVAECVELGC
jgi:hypothetical protein